MVWISKDEVGIVVDELNKIIKIKLLFNERTFISGKIPDKLDTHGYKKFEYGKMVIEHLKSGGYFYINYSEPNDFVELCVDDFYLSDTKTINVKINLKEFIDCNDLLDKINQNIANNELKKIIIKQNAHINFLNTKLSKLTDLIQDMNNTIETANFNSKYCYPDDYGKDF